jgi:hypothetical protein
VTTARIPVRPPRVYEPQVAFASEKKTPPKRGLDRGVLGIFGTVRGDGGVTWSRLPWDRFIQGRP